MMDAFPPSFESLWQRWYRPLRLYARGFGGLCDEDRDEAVADILLSAWERRRSYRPPWALSTWLYRLARNRLIDRQRSQTSHAVPVRAPVEAAVDTRAGNDPEALALAAESLREVRAALGYLAQVDREILHLRYVEDLGDNAIGAVTGLSPGGVRSRLSRARARLRTMLEVDHG